jgi:hypothetical protein
MEGDQVFVFPLKFVIIIMVLLKVDWTCAILFYFFAWVFS